MRHVCLFIATRLIGGLIYDSVEASALSFHRDQVDIYTNSWGPNDDGKTVAGPKTNMLNAFEDGVKVVSITMVFHTYFLT